MICVYCRDEIRKSLVGEWWITEKNAITCVARVTDSMDTKTKILTGLRMASLSKEYGHVPLGRDRAMLEIASWL